MKTVQRVQKLIRLGKEILTGWKSHKPPFFLIYTKKHGLLMAIHKFNT
jgi:hypothetical protein